MKVFHQLPDWKGAFPDWIRSDWVTIITNLPEAITSYWKVGMISIHMHLFIVSH